jgi:hypothetical protein
MADWRHDQDFGFWGAVLGGMIATYFTFIPCCFWIFQGGPTWSRFRGNHFLSGALTAITAALVGVILNLAVWFGLNVLFPAAQGIDWFALEVAAISFQVMQRFKLYIIPVVTRHRRPRFELQLVILTGGTILNRKHKVLIMSMITVPYGHILNVESFLSG